MSQKTVSLGALLGEMAPLKHNKENSLAKSAAGTIADTRYCLQCGVHVITNEGTGLLGAIPFHLYIVWVAQYKYRLSSPCVSR